MGKKSRIPTMEDVARLAGVNRVTASVVLNNARANTQVSEVTRKRVLEAARQLDYHRNAQALALRRQTTDIIGFYTGYNPNMQDPFIAEVLNGIQQATVSIHKDLLMVNEYPGRSADNVLSLIRSSKIDGLVMIPSPHDPVMSEFADTHRPVVTLADELARIPAVVVDDARGTQLLVEHLAGKGHRRILYRADPFNHTSAVTRLETFLKLAPQFGMEAVVTRTNQEDGSLSQEEIKILSSNSNTRPTVCMCWADTNAYACASDCLKMGLHIPEDVAVVGFDGIQMRVQPAFSLTTIRAPWKEAAIQAVEFLGRLMTGEDVPARTIFPVELLVGETT
jgi:DNA-binding LacI/PurR family transcriptional regulator